MFIIFATLQYNDPQPVPWMTAYGAAAVLSIFAALNQTFKLANVITIVFVAIWLVVSIPEFLHVIVAGNDAISSGQNFQNPKTKFLNEFFGLIIIILALAFQLKVAHKPKSQQFS